MSITPSGMQGKDWEIKKLTVKSGGSAIVTASAHTINALPHNMTRVVLAVNGVDRADSGEQDKADASVTYTINGDGRYELIARTSNENADAYTCTINVEKLTGVVIEG